ncbi:MAG TPA: DinB family protein [Ktedonobacteraceae bacterium]
MVVAPIDFQAVRAGGSGIQDFANTLTLDDLKQATELTVNTMLGHIASCVDADVSFVALDPEATEGLKNTDGEVLGWTLSHVIAHTTALGEASAFTALELARGISLRELSLYETPWTELTTIEHCRQRLNESLRMRLASLTAWPDRPNLTNRYTPFPGSGELNAKGIFLLGLEHDNNHQNHLAKIVQQLHK